MANADTTFGISGRKSGDLHIGDKLIIFPDDGSNDIKIDDVVYKGTPGLWELITMKEPNEELIIQDDMSNYAKILFDTEGIYQPGSTTRVRSSPGYKYKNYIKPIWANRDKIALAQEKAYSEQETALAQEEAYKEAEQMHAATPKKKKHLKRKVRVYKQ